LAQGRKIYYSAGLAYLAFVVYGSLVPLDFRARPFDSALRDFFSMPYFELDASSRADWVANILLYIPLAYLWLGALTRERRRFRQAFFSLLVFAFCATLIVAIEFTQQFFPPRTVSLNDLIAETIGTVLGIILWWTSGQGLRRLFEIATSQERNAAYAGLILYSSAYLVFSLFPFDFLISAQEIERKWAGNYFSFLASPARCGEGLRCGVKMAAEAAAAAPLGLLLSFILRRRGWKLIQAGACIGLWLGFAIESLQFFLASGVTLGASVLTRMAGIAAGAALGAWLQQSKPWPLLYLWAPWMPFAAALYVGLLLTVALQGRGPMLSAERGLERLSEIYFMPFYYHYYTSEAEAMTSLLGVASMFFPVGIMYWIWRIVRMREFIGRGAIQAALLSGLIGAALETIKLFFRGARPDPTNVLIASAAAAISFLAVSLCTHATLNNPAPLDDRSAREAG